MHIELFLEEPSAEAFLSGFLPKLLPAGTTWNPIVFQGKLDLPANLERRLKGYKSWMPSDWKIVVLIDEDRADCLSLKQQMETAAADAGWLTKSAAKGGTFTVLNRIALEELEAWFLGDIPALATAYPGVSPKLGAKTNFRNPDAIGGGTWEALERVLQRAGYYGGGLPKIEVAREMARHMDPARNISPSFRCFTEGLADL
jgi:hypothetical protein